MHDSMRTRRIPVTTNILIQTIATTTAKVIAKATLITLGALVVVTVIRGMVTLSLM